MPGRDGTGPMGRGTMTGRGLGVCISSNLECYGIGLGLGRRKGLGKNYKEESTIAKTQKELLQERKKLLEKRLDIIGKQLENL